MDIGNGYIVQIDNLYFVVYMSNKCIPFTEKIILCTEWRDKLKKMYPNAEFKDKENTPKHVLTLIDKYKDSKYKTFINNLL